MAATIILTHTDGTVEALGVSAGSAPNKVVLSGAPRLPLAIGVELVGKARFEIVPAGGAPDAFLVSEKEPHGETVLLRAVNYDSRYYARDVDHPAEDV